LTRFAEHEFIGWYGGNRIPTHEKLVKTSTPPPPPALHSIYDQSVWHRKTDTSESVLTQRERERWCAHTKKEKERERERERDDDKTHRRRAGAHTHTKREEKESEKMMIHRLGESDGAVSVLCQRWEVVCH